MYLPKFAKRGFKKKKKKSAQKNKQNFIVNIIEDFFI